MQFQELYDFLVDNEIITTSINEKGETYTSITDFLIDNEIFNGEDIVAGKVGNENLTKVNNEIIATFMYHFQANHIYGTHFAQMIGLSGNMASDFGHSQSKRAKQFGTPGTLVFGDVKILEYSDIDMNDVNKQKSISELEKGLEKAGTPNDRIKNLLAKYNEKIDTTDGSGQMTIGRYIEYLKASNKEALYEKNKHQW